MLCRGRGPSVPLKLVPGRGLLSLGQQRLRLIARLHSEVCKLLLWCNVDSCFLGGRQRHEGALRGIEGGVHGGPVWLALRRQRERHQRRPPHGREVGLRHVLSEGSVVGSPPRHCHTANGTHTQRHQRPIAFVLGQRFEEARCPQGGGGQHIYDGSPACHSLGGAGQRSRHGGGRHGHREGQGVRHQQVPHRMLHHRRLPHHLSGAAEDDGEGGAAGGAAGAPNRLAAWRQVRWHPVGGGGAREAGRPHLHHQHRPHCLAQIPQTTAVDGGRRCCQQ
mmetsp:Transcript_3033/g.8859  ORF Transcript_3033/g.8859 Transcript_3033/m.8859 type:complete len:277 (+) Transcript_3033:1093-1923(+)